MFQYKIREIYSMEINDYFPSEKQRMEFETFKEFRRPLSMDCSEQFMYLQQEDLSHVSKHRLNLQYRDRIALPGFYFGNKHLDMPRSLLSGMVVHGTIGQNELNRESLESEKPVNRHIA